MELALRTPVHTPPSGGHVTPPLGLDEPKGAKVEQWGLCVSCDRWFYCGTSAEQPRECRCPACDQVAVAIRETWE
jgi:hypothetical protein